MVTQQKDELKTIVIENFGGQLTRVVNGKLDSGLAKYLTTYGNDPFTSPRVLKFMEPPVDITGATITDLVVAGCFDSNTNLIFLLGNTGRIYSVQPTTSGNALYDHVILITTLTVDTPTFNGAPSIISDGIGGLYIGHDKGVTYVSNTGANETFIGILANWIGGNQIRSTVPFAGYQYYVNGSNITGLTLNATGSTVNNVNNPYAVLNPGFPNGTFINDLSVSTDGTRLVMLVSSSVGQSIGTTAYDNWRLSGGQGNIGALIAYWNGIDTGYTAYYDIGAFKPTKYFTLNGNEYCMGQGLNGVEFKNPLNTIATLPYVYSPRVNAMNSNGNMLMFATSEFSGGALNASLFQFGQYDEDYPSQALYRNFRIPSSLTGGDVIRVPFMLPVSTFQLTGASATSANNVQSYARIYFSDIEYNGSTTKYHLYSFNTFPQGTGTSGSGVYETQTQIFGEKMKVTEARIYHESGVSGQSYQIDLINSDGSVLNGGTATFTEGSNMDAFRDLYNPAGVGTYAIGVRITNFGTVTPSIHKIELDYEPFGK